MKYLYWICIHTKTELNCRNTFNHNENNKHEKTLDEFIININLNKLKKKKRKNYKMGNKERKKHEKSRRKK